jgi:hypothetical protein
MAKARAQGADVQLLAKIETTYGTAPTGNWRPLVASKWDGGGKKPLGYEPELGQGADAQDPFYDALNVDLNFDIHMRVREIGFWLKHLFGAPTTTGANPYTHVFTSGNELPSLSIEEGHVAITSPKYFVRTGCKLGGLQIALERMGPAKATITGMAQQVSKSNSSAGGTPVAAYAAGKFMNNALLIKKDGTALAQLTGGRLNYSSNLERVETIGRGDGLIEGADESDRTTDGNLDLRLTADMTLYDAAMTNESAMDLLFRWTTPINAAYKLDLDFGRVFVGWTQPPIPGPGGITAALDFRAAKQSSSVAMLTATLINDISAY